MKMQAVLSKTGIEVCYPCTVHLLQNGENFECEYKSDHIGRDLLDYVCAIQKISDLSIWGLKFMDTGCMDEQRHWLDLDKLIRSQVKTISPIRFYFRVKVYPPEPYRIPDQSIRHSIYQQLRLDLLGGRLFCNVNDAAMLTALILQHVHGNFVHSLYWMYITYIKSKILRKERCSSHFFVTTQKRALELYEKLLVNLRKLEVEDMFLRLASKLDSYGVEPFLVRNIDKREVILWMNHYGMRAFHKKRKMFYIDWGDITKITHEGKGLFVHLAPGGVKVFESISFSECNYIWSTAVDHLMYFTSKKYKAAGAGMSDRQYNENNTVSELSSFFGSCIAENPHLESDIFKNDLQMSHSFFKLIDLNTWKSQLPVIYALFVIYMMGATATVLDELPWIYSLKKSIRKFLSAFVFNKMLSF